ncbi:MAG: hypothetical protein Phog2KO_38780 [Phototrophicaceae bacterium]
MAKRKRSEKFVTYIITGIFTCILIALGSLLLAIALPVQANYETHYLATAQYLDQHPAQTPNFIRINEDCDADSLHCFWIFPDELTSQHSNPQNFISSLTLRINGSIQENVTSALIDSAFYIDLDLAEFGTGLHLIEIQIQDSNGHIHQHTWSAGIDGEELSPPPTLAVPPTYSTAIPTTDD